MQMGRITQEDNLLYITVHSSSVKRECRNENSKIDYECAKISLEIEERKNILSQYYL